MRLTVWHKGTNEPVRDGVYQRNYGGKFSEKPVFCKFANGAWYCCGFTVEKKKKETTPSISQIMDWRGIVKEN